jgi:hypothetical protein
MSVSKLALARFLTARGKEKRWIFTQVLIPEGINKVLKNLPLIKNRDSREGRKLVFI